MSNSTKSTLVSNILNQAAVSSNKLAILTMYLHEQYKLYSDKDIKFTIKQTKSINYESIPKKVTVKKIIKPTFRNSAGNRGRKSMNSGEFPFQRKLTMKKSEISDADEISDNDDELQSD